MVHLCHALSNLLLSVNVGVALSAVNLTQKSKVWQSSSLSVGMFICLSILPHRPWAELDCVCGSAAAAAERKASWHTKQPFPLIFVLPLPLESKVGDWEYPWGCGDEGWDHKRQRRGVWRSRIKQRGSSCVFTAPCVSIAEQSNGRRSKCEIVHN